MCCGPNSVCTWNAVSIAEFHTSFCMQWIAESSDSIDDSAGERKFLLVLPLKSKQKPQISPWKRLDFDVILLLFRLVLLLLLIVLLLSCCSDVCEGFDWNEYVNWRLICLLYWSFSRGTVRNKNKKVLMKIENYWRDVVINDSGDRLDGDGAQVYRMMEEENKNLLPQS